MTFQEWAQSLDPKVWAKNDIAYAKLAWDEGRQELEAKHHELHNLNTTICDFAKVQAAKIKELEAIDENWKKIVGVSDYDRTLRHLNKIKELEAKVDSLMLEYCPSDMTSEQYQNWEKHQAAFLYKGYWIVRSSRVEGNNTIFRIKAGRDDDYSLHHGSFDNKKAAMAWLDRYIKWERIGYESIRC